MRVFIYLLDTSLFNWCIIVFTRPILPREYDVPYHTRVSIDLSIFVGLWYEVKVETCGVVIDARPDIVDRPVCRGRG